MRHIILCLSLLFTLPTLAQIKGNPCAAPVLALYDAQNKRLPEGAVPQGEISIALLSHPACTRQISYQVQKARLVLVAGVRPIAERKIEGNTLDLSDMARELTIAGRIFIEMPEVACTFENGEVVTFPKTVMDNWHLQH